MAYTTIKKPSDYFNTKLYTGNSTDNHTISGVGFQPDFTWIKDRDRSGYNHRLQDSVRGATKSLISNLSNAEQTNADAVKSFNSDGFVLGNDAGNGSFNGNSNFVSWNWLGANGTVANTDGDIASTVSASATSGFSIVKYSGIATNATVGHGLGVAPKMIIVKDLGASVNWQVYHSSIANTEALELNGTGGKFTAANRWNSTSATSSVFSIGTSTETNGDGHNIIAYCFAEKTGYSKFGSYVGNGSATEGTFFYTGFKPAMIIIKKTDNGQWTIFDNKRNPSNAVRAMLVPNADATELSQNENNMDFLSNGVKMYNADGVFNASGGTYIYAAFAEAPLVGTNNVPCTAR